MKRTIRITGYIIIALIILAIGLVMANRANADTDAQLEQIDRFIESHGHYEHDEEPETVSLSYSEWQEQQEAETEAEPNIYDMDVWQLGSYLYDISELDTTRTLKLITYEGYGYSPLSYYVACCCWVRATEGYWGYPNIYRAFGEADGNYDEWMDGIEIADWAYDALWQAYMNPSYVRYCNGMTVPEGWIYEENGIFVWN